MDAAQLLCRLAELRTRDTLTQDHPGVTFVPLPQALRQWGAAGVNAGPFHTGLALLRPRYAALGLSRLLPLDRVVIGVRSREPGAFGGFHHPNQGYRHLQMRALITAYGPMSAGHPRDAGLAALDLLRSYAHDCLHWGAFRSYRLRDGEPFRSQYGLSVRRHDGRSYSAPDLAGSPTTRNLGIVMEGACDREARAITHEAARRCGVPEPGGFDRFAFRDVTGLLDVSDTDGLADPAVRAALGSSEAAAAYLEAMGKYQRGVNARYCTFLDEIGQEGATELHTVVLGSMISGLLTGLCTWLERRHGANAFASLFLSPAYFGAVPKSPARG